MSRYKYPETVPVLASRDICQGMKSYNGHYTNDPETCPRCLIGQAVYTFLGKDSSMTSDYALLPRRVKEALHHGVRKVFDLKGHVKGASYIYCANDIAASRKGGKTKVAKAWNIAMAYLGYTDNNPEA